MESKRTFNSICVYCGSSSGTNDKVVDQTRVLGTELARRGIRLVYGGGNHGLMGEVARSVLENKGSVLGVIPDALSKYEISGSAICKIVRVKDMHERKVIMAVESDAFIALPGGLGTMEELLEILTWVKLGIHTKPVGVLNVDGYWDPMVKLLEHARDSGFLSLDLSKILVVEENIDALLDKLETLKPFESQVKGVWPKFEVPAEYQDQLEALKKE